MSKYAHGDVYSKNHEILPKVFIAPPKYVQGKNALSHLSQYLSTLPHCDNVAVIITKGGESRIGDILTSALKSLKFTFHYFNKECSYEETERLTQEMNMAKYDCTLAIGGGKLIDCAKLVAFQMELPLVVCSSLASNDGPCSALSIMYSPEGACVGAECFPMSPSIVVVDLSLLVNAPIRTFAAGMGDAMATYYEADTCYRNPKALTMLSARPTEVALSIAKLCRDTLLCYGESAIQACLKKQVNDAFEKAVEANTLHSGLGFESGGVSSAHAIAQSLTVIPSIEENYMHGEMVAMGLLTLLALQDKDDELLLIANFFDSVGLPIHFSQLQLDMEQELPMVLQVAQQQWFLKNESVDTSTESLKKAMHKADQVGKRVALRTGNVPFCQRG